MKHELSSRTVTSLAVAIVFSAVVLLSASAIDAAVTTRQGPFGGEFRVEERGPHLSEELRAEIRGKIDRNIAILKEQGCCGRPRSTSRGRC